MPTKILTSLLSIKIAQSLCFLICFAFYLAPLETFALLQEPESQSIQPRFSASTAVFPSPFSYHVIREVTEFQINNFLRTAREDAGINLKFLNPTEYSNIVHALSIKTGGFLTQGSDFLRHASSNQTTAFVLPEATGSPFFIDIFEFAWAMMERRQVGDGSAEAPLIYLKDIRGDLESGTISSFSLGVQAFNGEQFNIRYRERGVNLVPLLFPYSSMQGSFNPLLQYPLLARHVRQSLWESFQAFLETEGLSAPLDGTLYLKSLSSADRPIERLQDFEHINIGVLIEGEDGDLRDLDWMVERDRLAIRIPNWSWVENHIVDALHESAHEITRKALLDDRTYLSLLSVMETLLVNSFSNEMRPVFGQHTYFIETSTPTRRQTIYQLAEILAGDTIEDMLPQNEGERASGIIGLVTDLDNLNGLSFDVRNVFLKVNQDVCRHLSYSQERCRIPQSVNGWKQWLEDLPDQERRAFQRETAQWTIEASILARQVLTRHIESVMALTRLLLERGLLSSDDMDLFYEDLGLPITIPVAEYEDVPFNLSVVEALTARGKTYSPGVFETDLFYNALAQGFAFDVRQAPVTRGSSRQEAFEQLQTFEIKSRFLNYVRQEPLEGTYATPYAQGLPPLYFKFIMQVFPENSF